MNDVYAYLFTRRAAELLEIDEMTLINAIRSALYECSSTVAVFRPDGTVEVERPHEADRRNVPGAREFEAAKSRLGRVS